MSRDWVKVHACLSDHPKWIRLTPVERGAWVTILVVAVSRDGRFRNRDAVETVLARDGFDDPVGTLDRLISERLIDLCDDAGLILHDWADHQIPWRGPSDDPDAVAERKRRSRGTQGQAKSQQASRDVTNGHDRGDRRGIDQKGIPFVGKPSLQDDPTDEAQAIRDLFRQRKQTLSAKQIVVLRDLADNMRRSDTESMQVGFARLAATADECPAGADVFAHFVADRDRRRREARTEEGKRVREHRTIKAQERAFIATHAFGAGLASAIQEN